MERPGSGPGGSGQGARHDGEPDRLRLPGGRPFFMRFLHGMSAPRRTILGTEFAGEVEAVGGGVTSLRGGRPGVRVQRGPVRRARRVPVVREERRSRRSRRADLRAVAPATEGAHYALSHQGREIGAGQTCWSTARRARSARRPSAAEESRRHRDRGLRHGEPGAGGVSAPTGSSTTPPGTSPRTSRPTTSCSTRWARARSADASGC